MTTLEIDSILFFMFCGAARLEGSRPGVRAVSFRRQHGLLGNGPGLEDKEERQ